MFCPKVQLRHQLLATRHLHLPLSLLPLTTHPRTHSTHQLLERRSALLALQTLLQRLQTHRLLGRVLLQVLALQLLALFLISQPHTHAHPLAQLARTLLTRPQTLLAAAQLLLLAVQTLDLVHVAAVLLQKDSLRAFRTPHERNSAR